MKKYTLVNCKFFTAATFCPHCGSKALKEGNEKIQSDFFQRSVTSSTKEVTQRNFRSRRAVLIDSFQTKIEDKKDFYDEQRNLLLPL